MMSASRWKVLTAYLPGIASVVNSFQSPAVQMEVYQSLIKALEEKVDAEEAYATAMRSKPSTARSKSLGERDQTPGNAEGELLYDLVEGENIHALMGKN